MGVTGFGGLLFRARDPDMLTAWYRDNLNVGAGCSADAVDPAGEWVWKAAGGPTMFAPLKATTDYFAADKAFMINLRVSDLDALIVQLRQDGIPVETRVEWDDPTTGKFARVHDPEGYAIELWEPPA